MSVRTGCAAYAERALDLRHEGNMSLVTPTLQGGHRYVSALGLVRQDEHLRAGDTDHELQLALCVLPAGACGVRIGQSGLCHS